MIKNVLAFSEKGAVRSENQDAVYTANTKKTGIFAVADGMGGHYEGSIASVVTTDMLRNWWEQTKDNFSEYSFFDIVDSLEKKIHAINAQIYKRYQREGQQGGTTLCMLFLHDNFYAVFNVGDSRIYYCSRKRWQQLSVDDVWENQPSIRAIAAKTDLSKDLRWGKLTRAIGSEEQVAVSMITGELKEETFFFLCSDGIHKYYEEEKIKKILRKIRKPENTEKVLEKLKAGVYQNGASDNLSAILIAAGRK